MEEKKDNKVLTSKVVLKEMLVDRGYTEETLRPIDETIITHSYTAIVMDKIKTAIVYDLNDKFKWSDVEKFLNDKLNMDDLSLIIFIITAPTSTATKKIEIKTNFQLFNIQDLQMNISKHFLQPKMTLITDQDEIDQILKNYDLKFKNQLPQMLSSDPMAKYYNAKPNNVMKIDRVSQTSGINTVYRLIV